MSVLPQQWEYLLDDSIDTEVMDSWGAAGWELVAVVRGPGYLQMFYKRPQVSDDH